MKFFGPLQFSFTTLGVLLFYNAPAFGGLGLDLSGVFSNLSSFLDPGLAAATVKTMGLTFDHRPLEPATPLGTQLGFDVGFEVDVVQLPPLLSDALQNQGFAITLPPILPSAKLFNLHKGISDRIDIGFAWLGYSAFRIWGCDLKINLVNPEEGLTWAFRLGMGSFHASLGQTSLLNTNVSVNIDATTWTPAILASRKMGFADPYVGVGYQYATGSINLSADSQLPDGFSVSSVSGSGGSPFAFTGISMKVPESGLSLRITLEGTYSVDGFNALSTKIGFAF